MQGFKVDFINLLPCEPGFATEERILDHEYLLYVHAGKGIFKIGNVSYSASMGDLFYCPTGVRNTILANEQDPFLLSGIDYRAPKETMDLKKRVSLLPYPFLINVIQEMVREYRYGKIGSEEICGALLETLLINLQRMSTGVNGGRGDPAEEMLDYIAENLHRSITHQELSRVFSYQKTSINRILRRKTGLSLKNYVIELRIRKASELLKYSSKSIGQIGEFCGYNSAVFFSRQFREKTGMTPMQFRRNYS